MTMSMDCDLLCSDDEKSLQHFKLRVLDLVELFLQKEPTNPLIFVSGLVVLDPCIPCVSLFPSSGVGPAPL